jgi:hypothetical protein
VCVLVADTLDVMDYKGSNNSLCRTLFEERVDDGFGGFGRER